MPLAKLFKSHAKHRLSSALIGTVLMQLLLVVASVQGNSGVASYEASVGLPAGGVLGAAGLCRHASPATIKNSMVAYFPLWSLSGNPASAERTVRQVVVDIDHDGDPDLIAITNLPRLLVWLNDGTGHFTSYTPAPSFRRLQIPEDPDSGGADTPPLFPWLTTEVLEGPLVPLASAELDINAPPTSFDCLNQSSPRAPPLTIS